MPRIARQGRISAPVRVVWEVVSDPNHLPRWWPRTTRVENVRGEGKRASWTLVFETEEGRGVRADYSAVSSKENESFVFDQQVEGTPFERVMKGSTLEIRLEADGEEATNVELRQEQTLSGFSRFGSPMVRRASGRILDEALEGLEEAIGSDERGGEGQGAETGPP